jgi:hypothetical protein
MKKNTVLEPFVCPLKDHRKPPTQDSGDGLSTGPRWPGSTDSLSRFTVRTYSSSYSHGKELSLTVLVSAQQTQMSPHLQVAQSPLFRSQVSYAPPVSYWFVLFFVERQWELMVCL